MAQRQHTTPTSWTTPTQTPTDPHTNIHSHMHLFYFISCVFFSLFYYFSKRWKMLGLPGYAIERDVGGRGGGEECLLTPPPLPPPILHTDRHTQTSSSPLLSSSLSPLPLPPSPPSPDEFSMIILLYHVAFRQKIFSRRIMMIADDWYSGSIVSILNISCDVSRYCIQDWCLSGDVWRYDIHDWDLSWYVSRCCIALCVFPFVLRSLFLRLHARFLGVVWSFEHTCLSDVFISRFTVESVQCRNESIGRHPVSRVVQRTLG